MKYNTNSTYGQSPVQGIMMGPNGEVQCEACKRLMSIHKVRENGWYDFLIEAERHDMDDGCIRDQMKSLYHEIPDPSAFPNGGVDHVHIPQPYTGDPGTAGGNNIYGQDSIPDNVLNIRTQTMNITNGSSNNT